MRPFFSQLFHRQFRKPHVLEFEGSIPHGPRYKEYPRLPRTLLPEPLPLKQTIEASLLSRKSADAFSPKNVTLLVTLSTLLSTAARIRTDEKRPYPSGGALYPIEIYVLANAVEGLMPGTYHYHPKLNALEQLTTGQVPGDIYMQPQHAEMGTMASFAIILTACWHRNAGKYGEGAYQLALIEAGHLMQNIVLAATSLELTSRTFAGFVDEGIEELLDLHEGQESPVYVALVGN